MSKIIVIDEQEQTRVPFLRGILTRSLQDAGLDFNDAYRLASRVKEQLDGEVAIQALRQRAAEMLREQFDQSIVERYLAVAKAPATVLVTDANQQVSAFSRGRHQRSVEACGITAAQAAEVTARIYEELLNDGVEGIRTCELGQLTYDTLRTHCGEAAARHYLTWAEFSQSGRPLVLLFAGTVGCGKSTIATEVAHRLGIVRTQSTDLLREVMRMMIPERLMPVLHTSSFKAWQALPFAEKTMSDRVLAEGFQSQAELLSVPCEAVVRRALRERVSLIIEGVHIRPALLEQIAQDSDAVVVMITLAILSPNLLKSRIRGRGVLAPQRRAKRYLDNFEAIWRIQSFLLDEADRHDVPIVTNESKDRALRGVMSVIGQELSRHFSAAPAKVFGTPSQRSSRLEVAD